MHPYPVIVAGVVAEAAELFEEVAAGTDVGLAPVAFRPACPVARSYEVVVVGIQAGTFQVEEHHIVIFEVR
jgi:hypothetical protein